MEGRGRKGTNLIVSSLFLPLFCGPHTGLSHQGQRPKTVEASITAESLFGVCNIDKGKCNVWAESE
jgi:hypothetical protein